MERAKKTQLPSGKHQLAFAPWAYGYPYHIGRYIRYNSPESAYWSRIFWERPVSYTTGTVAHAREFFGP